MNCSIIQIDKQTWRFEESGVRFFLLTGTQRALLIDSGMEVHNARELAESLTELPVSLLNTHGDGDHTGSNHEFNTVYMNPAEMVNYAKDGKTCGLNPVWDGDCIQLGERELEAVTIPGHTPGSIALLDKERRVLFSGDTVQDGNIFMFGPMRNIPAFYHSLRRLKALEDKFDIIYPSHGTFPVNKDLIEDMIAGVERLERGELKPYSAEFRGRPLQRYSIGRASLLCDMEYGQDSCRAGKI